MKKRYRKTYLFEKIYGDDCDVSNIRKQPITKAEFLKNDYTEQDFDSYAKEITKLYGFLFAMSCGHGSVLFNSGFNARKEIWEDFVDFCIDYGFIRQLLLEPDFEPNYRPFQYSDFTDIYTFKFLYQSNALPDFCHLVTLNEFRLYVERLLASEQNEAWYIEQCYDAYLSNDTGCFYHLENDHSHVNFTRAEMQNMLTDLKSKINAQQKRIDKNKMELLQAAKNNDFSSAKREITCRKLVDEEYILYSEMQGLDDCYEFVKSYCDVDHNDESSNDETVSQIVEDDTLYISQCKFICEQQGHEISTSTAIMHDIHSQDIKLPVKYCRTCKKYFMSYPDFTRYRNRYGTILGKMLLVENNYRTFDNSELALESPLKLCGYTVNQKDNLSDKQRHEIILSCIEYGTMTIDEVLHLLDYLIDVNGSKTGNELACEKWLRDYDFVAKLDERALLEKAALHRRRNKFI